MTPTKGRSLTVWRDTPARRLQRRRAWNIRMLRGIRALCFNIEQTHDLPDRVYKACVTIRCAAIDALVEYGAKL